MRKKILIFNILFFLLFMAVIFTFANGSELTSTSFKLENSGILIGGGESASTNFKLISSIGQLTNGQSLSTSFSQNTGFLYFPTASISAISATPGITQVVLTWSASVGIFGNITDYDVGISTSSEGTYTYTSVGNVLTHTVTSLTAGTTYYFKVRSYAGGLLLNESSVVSATPTSTVIPPVTPPGGSGGGGGSSNDNENISTVNFSGMAYPLSKVIILKDGQIAVSSIADPGANFKISITVGVPGNYTFSVYGEDDKGRKSSYFSFPISVTTGATINIGNIFLSPTVDIDKSQVKQGDNLAIFGQSAPQSEVTISVHSNVESFYKVLSNKMGVYLYNLDTSSLEIGSHLTKSKAAIDGELSSFSPALAFIVGNENKLPEAKKCLTRGDLNNDCKVNLVDFSIMAYWYKKSNPPTKIDLNNDKKISLIDFSIMAYNWTG